MLMETTPNDVDLDLLKQELAQLYKVKAVHDLHVWSLSDGKYAMSCHLVVSDSAEQQSVLEKCSNMLREAFRINHFSIQIETDKYLCGNDLHD